MQSEVSVHFNLQCFLQDGVPGVAGEGGGGCFFPLQHLFLAASRCRMLKIVAMRSCAGGPMQVFLIISGFKRGDVKRDVKAAWQDCWGGKRIWCTASTPHPPRSSPSSSPSPHRKFMASGEHKLIRFAYYPSPHRDGSIDHRFVWGYVDRWITAQVKNTNKEGDAIRTRTVMELVFLFLFFFTPLRHHKLLWILKLMEKNEIGKSTGNSNLNFRSPR